MPEPSILTALPSIDGMRIDITAIRSIAHDCRPEACNHAGGCCGYYDVYIHRSELDGLIGMMPAAAAHIPRLRSGEGYVNVFESEDDNEFSIDKTDDGNCAFGYGNGRTETWCALHTAALDLNIPLIEAKPKACLLWPLALTETQPTVLSVQDGAFDFACNQPRSEFATDLDPGIASIVNEVFGPTFSQALNRILDPCG